MKAFAAAMLAGALAAGCALRPVERLQLPEVAKFSEHTAGETLPPGWQTWHFAGFKKPTDYRLVDEDGRTVMKAMSERSASGLVHGVRVDLKAFPYLHWRWKITGLIETADNTRPQSEDSPARVIVAFEGDAAKLPLADRLFSQQFKMFTKAELPYATLMYIWGNQQPIGTVITSQFTSRIKMMVAESGSERIGEWQEVVRNVYEDYRLAFGEEPPPIKSVAIMTDSDNTGTQAAAYYGDIAFLSGPE